MKQRFLNQKLGKRMSRKADLQRAKVIEEKRQPLRETGAHRRPGGHPPRQG